MVVLVKLHGALVHVLDPGSHAEDTQILGQPVILGQPGGIVHLVDIPGLLIPVEIAPSAQPGGNRVVCQGEEKGQGHDGRMQGGQYSQPEHQAYHIDEQDCQILPDFLRRRDIVEAHIHGLVHPIQKAGILHVGIGGLAHLVMEL